MRITAIVQARMTSSRLPGKVLMDIAGSSMLARVIERAKAAESIAEIIIATTKDQEDDPITEEAARMGIPFFRGERDDVLDRYYGAATQFQSSAVMRITSDCPLLDPEILDRVAATFKLTRADYASNTIERSFPRGLDVEVFTFEALTRAWAEAVSSYERVHVTPFLYLNPERFSLASVVNESDYSHLRWTVDTAEDLRLIREIYARLSDPIDLRWTAIREVVEAEPHLMDLNRHVRQKLLKEG